jgi:mRNA interferase RelE/StbE
VQRILARIETLRDDPRPPDSEKLAAQERYRLRQGGYRILYTVTQAEAVIEVVKVGHRRDVYRAP